jgi:glycosyltransferase involved in cell wall biosynthesis
MAAASLVVTGNEYLAERAFAAGAKRITVIPTVIDLPKYPSAPSDGNAEFTVGWIGSPVTQPALESISGALRAFFANDRGQVAAIGANADLSLPGCPVTIVPWSDQTEVQELCKIHVGVMPLLSDAASRGKCGFKLIQYMGCYLPVIAAPIGANNQIVVPGETGLFASNETEWLNALIRLRSDEGFRRRLGAAGRVRTERMYSINAVLPRLASALKYSTDKPTEQTEIAFPDKRKEQSDDCFIPYRSEERQH